jgi:hypothetical protein
MIQRFRCGWQVNPGDTEALAGLMDALARKRHLISEAGCRAGQAFEQHYGRPMGAARIIKILGLIPEPEKLSLLDVASAGRSIPRPSWRGAAAGCFPSARIRSAPAPPASESVTDCLEGPH